MIADILNNISENTKYVYQLKLRKTDLTLLAFIPFVSLTFTKRFRDYNELSFEIADQIYVSHTHTLEPNPIWETIKASHVIELNIYSNNELAFAEYYTVQLPNEQGGENEHRKTFSCIPTHQAEFNKKKLRGLNDTRKLFDFDLEYYKSTGYTDLRPYAFKNINQDLEGEYTTYNPKLYTCGGVLNYIIEYILNKDSPIDENDIEATEVKKQDTSDYIKNYYYPSKEIDNYPALEEKGYADFPSLPSYYRVTNEKTGQKGFLTDNKYWKVRYYDPALLEIWSNTQTGEKKEYNADEIYDFFYGKVIIKYTDRTTNDLLSDNESTTQVPYLANGIMTYWNYYQKSGKGTEGINLKDGSITGIIEKDDENNDWYNVDWSNSTHGFTYGNWNEDQETGGPTIGRTGFAGGDRQKLEDYEHYIPSDYNSMQEVEKQSRLFFDIWSKRDYDNTSPSSSQSYVDQTGLFSAWGVPDFDPTYDGNFTMLLGDLAKPDSSDWFYNILTDPLAGAVLAQRADACLSQLQNYIDVFMTATAAMNITKSRTSPNTGETEEKEIHGYDTKSFKEAYDALTAFYQRVVYFFWYPIYEKFGTYTGKMPYRTLNIDNQNLTEVFKTLEEEFMCRFEFDNINKEIYIYAYNNEKYQADSQLVLSPYNYITDLTLNRNVDQVITRLYVEGKDGLWFTGIHPAGQRFIDDFSFFMSTDYMSQELIDALHIYQEILKKYTLQGDGADDSLYETVTVSYNVTITGDPVLREWSGTYNNFYYKWKHVLEDYSNAFVLYNQIKQIETSYDNAKSTLLNGLEEGDDGYNAALINLTATQDSLYNSAAAIAHELEGYIGTLFTTGDTPYIKWENIDPRFDVLKRKATAFDEKMQKIKLGLTYKNIHYTETIDEEGNIIYSATFDNTGEKLFSEELLSNLRRFIIEDDQSQSSISDEATLFNYGQDYLKFLSFIPVDIDINLVDILSVPTFYQDWSRINDVGKKCRILYPKLGYNLETDKMLTLTEYTHTYSSDTQNLSLKLSNNNDVIDLQYRLQINTWLNAYKAYKMIDKYRASWDDYIANKNQILWQGQNIYASANPIVDNMGNRIVDGTGVVLSKANGNQIKKYSDGLYCGSITGSVGNSYVIELQDFYEQTATQEKLDAFTADLDDNTLVIIYDKNQPYIAGTHFDNI